MWGAIKLYWSKIWIYIKPAVMVLLSEIGQRALAIAIEVVKDLATQDMSNSDKRDAAFDNIKDQLEEEGKEIGSSIINLVIELAVAKLKSTN